MNTSKISTQAESAETSVPKSTLEQVFSDITPKQVVDKALETTNVKSESITKVVDLGKEVQAKSEKSWVGKFTTAALSGLAALTGKELFKPKEKNAIAKTSAAVAEVYTGSEENLKTTLDTIETLETETEELKAKIDATREEQVAQVLSENPKLSKKEALEKVDQKLDQLQETYGGAEKTVFSIFGNAWKETSTNKNGESRSWFGRALAFVPALIKEYGKFSLTKNLEQKGFFKSKALAKQKAAELKKRGKEVQDGVKELKNEAKNAGKKAKEKADQAKSIRNATKKSGALPALKLLKANNSVATKYTKSVDMLVKGLDKGKISPTEFAKSLSGQYEKSFSNLLKDLENGAIKPKKFAELSKYLLEDTQALAGKNKQVQTAFLKLVQKGEVPGMNLNSSVGKLSKIPVGAVGVASAVNISIIEAIEAGSFSKFWDSLTSKETLAEAFVPGVGTWNSIKRAQNTDNPGWLKAVDVGINIVGDVALTAGYIGSVFSFGSSAAGGVAARTGATALGRRFISKQTLKMACQAAKKSVKSGVKSSLLTSPFSAGLALLAKKIKGKDVETSATKFYTENIESEQQKRARKIAKRITSKTNHKNT